MAYLHKVLKVGNALGVCIPRAYATHFRVAQGFYCYSTVTAEGHLMLVFFDPEKRPDLIEHAEAEVEIDEE